MSIELKITDKTNVAFPIIIKNKNGNIIYKQNLNGVWCEWIFDDNNNCLTYKDSVGDWSEWTYDNGNELTYKDSDGYYEIKDKEVTKEEYEEFINNKEYEQ